jgi:hypothetical protein
MRGEMLQAALDLHLRGISVLDAPYGKKDQDQDGWNDMRLSEEDLRLRFNGRPRNLAVLLGEPSDGLVDVDLDCPEAMVLAREFLPTTGWRFGRGSKPESHWLYFADPIPQYASFKDVDGTMLVELRSTRYQTIFPPSTHPSGERIEWGEYEQPARLPAHELLRVVCRLAAATLLARRWPAKGSRNDAALALAGGLLRGGFDTGESGWFLGQVARAAGDDEWRERIATAEYTAARLAKKQPATGWPTLAELVGEKVVEKVREGLGMRDAEKESPPTQAEVLVGYADTVDLFHDPDWVGCASFEVNGHQETHPLRSQGVRRWLLHRYFRDYRKPPGSQALQDAVDTLEARAVIDGPERETHLRVAGRAGAIYVDLCNDCWEVVEVCADGWRVMPAEAVPVRFRRAKGMQPLPHPVSGGSLDGLRKLMNLPDDEKGWVLSVAWLVAAFRPEGPYPVLILQGEQGTAKSTAQRILRAIVDPSTTPLRTTPREMRDLMIAANNGWVVSFDNLSGLPIWLSDGLCRLATGGGFATRELYSDAEEVLFDATRPACLNGITGVATRPDLLDRSLIVELPVIPEERRRPERELWDEFAGEHPMILGILLDAVSGALAKADSVELPRLPRMADFAIWTTAAEEALGWEAGTFMAAYDESREETVAEALEGDLVAGAVLSFMKDRKEWIGGSASRLSC